MRETKKICILFLSPLFFFACGGPGFEALESNIEILDSQCPGDDESLTKISSLSQNETKKMVTYKVSKDVSAYDIKKEKEYVISRNPNCTSSLSSSSKKKLMEVKKGSNLNLEELKNDHCVLSIEEDREFYLNSVATNDPHAGQQRHLASIGYNNQFEEIFQLEGKITKKVVVAVIDSGMDMDHSDLRNQLWVNEAELNGQQGVDDDNNGYIDDINGFNFDLDDANPEDITTSSAGAHGHGTHVASLIAAQTNNQIGGSGVMGANVKIMVLNVANQNGGIQLSNVVKAIEYAADNSADILNMSLGGRGTSTATFNALKYASEQNNVTAFAASGNDGEELTSTNFFSPVGYAKDIEGFISVAANDASSTNSLCFFSNYSNQYVELTAPGCDSLAPILGNGVGGLLAAYTLNRYTRKMGTSMSSPVAAGVGAILHSYIHSRTGVKPSPAQMEQHLLAASRSVTLLNAEVKSGKQVHLDNLVDYVNSIFPKPQTPDDGGKPGC